MFTQFISRFQRIFDNPRTAARTNRYAAYGVFAAAFLLLGAVAVIVSFNPNTQESEYASADSFAASNFNVWSCKVSAVTSINRAGNATVGLRYNAADLRGESGDAWASGKAYVPTLSSGANVFYRRNDVATSVAVAPGMDVQMNVHYLNDAGHTVTVGVTYLFLSTPQPDQIGQDSTRLIAPGTNNREVKLGTAWYNSNLNGTAPLVPRGRYGKYVQTEGGDNITMGNGGQANRVKMFTFKALQPVVQTKPREVIFTKNAAGETIAEVRQTVKNVSVYTFVGNEVDVAVQNPKTNQVLTQAVPLAPGEEKTVSITLNLGDSKTTPAKIAAGEIRFNKSITEVVTPQTDAYNEYGRSVVFERDDTTSYNGKNWGTQLGRAVVPSPMQITVIPYQIPTEETTIPVLKDQIDLKIEKTEIPPTGKGNEVYNAGSTVTYNVKVTNLGPGDVTEFTVTDTAPATLTVNATPVLVGANKDLGTIVTGTNTTTADGKQVLTFGWKAKTASVLKAGQVIEFQLTGTIKQGVATCTDIINVAEVSNPDDTNAGNNKDDATIRTECGTTPPPVTPTPVTPVTPTPITPRTGGLEIVATIIMIVTLPLAYLLYIRQKKAEQVKLRWDY